MQYTVLLKDGQTVTLSCVFYHQGLTVAHGSCVPRCLGTRPWRPQVLPRFTAEIDSLLESGDSASKMSWAWGELKDRPGTSIGRGGLAYPNGAMGRSILILVLLGPFRGYSRGVLRR